MGDTTGLLQADESERLLLSVAEQLARPLSLIARLSESAEGDQEITAAQDRWATVQALAESSLQLVDNYAYSLRLGARVSSLALEPVTVASLLYETAEQLAPLAQQYGVSLELDTGPRVQPVLADRAVLRAAFVSLGQVFVQAQAEAEVPMPVRLMAHRNRFGMVAGLYGGTAPLGADSLRRARAIQGRARQPLPQLTSGSAAGVFVADSLLQALAVRLHAAKYHGLTGLAATLRPSAQLRLV